MAARLKDAECYNRHRGLLGFTGEDQGVRLSVQATGMGSPSAAIVMEELAELGVRTVLRLGTCGGIGPGVKVLDLVIAMASTPMDGTTRQYLDGLPFAPAANHEVVEALSAAARAGPRPFHVGTVVTQDAFYREEAAWERWAEFGVLATEMEISAIFTVAALRGMRAGAACAVLDLIRDRGTWVTDEDTQAVEEDLIDVGFRAAVVLAAGEG
jgi:purine-nucleoside phosphorylase